MSAEPSPMRREQAAKVVAEEIAGALQLRVAQWQTERSKIEAMMQREDRKRARFELLGELISAAEAEIATAMARAMPRLEVDAGESK